ncbi:MAG: VOC family protein [Acidimicrobiales bacterium]
MAISGVDLDHVAVAAEGWSDAWPRYVGSLGGIWASGGQNPGFAPAQLRFANGARIEVLQPWQPESNPFLRRFLDHSGPGPHHLTFKVADIAAALDAVEGAGFTPVSVDLSDPGWKEAFLHPRQATGVVVQLAEAAGSWEAPPPEGFPASNAVPAALNHVTHAVADLDTGLALFRDLLGGEPSAVEDAADGSWRAVTLRWKSPLAVRLVSPGRDSALTAWLGGRAGRVHHLALRQPGPGAGTEVPPGVADDELPVEVVEPAQNLGVRLVVSRS